MAYALSGFYGGISAGGRFCGGGDGARGTVILLKSAISTWTKNQIINNKRGKAHV